MKNDDSWVATGLLVLAACIAVGLIWRGGPVEAWALVSTIVGVVGGWLGRGAIDRSRQSNSSTTAGTGSVND